MNGNGNTTAVNSFGAAGLLSRHGASSVYYTFDPQGNVCQRLDGAQNILSTSVFDAYGTNLTGSTGEPWGYEGQAGYYTDTETGLTANTYRYYDPSQGRWLNRDPIGQAGGVNLYGYVGNGPVDDDDPDGLLPGGLGGAHNTTPPIDGWPAIRNAACAAHNGAAALINDFGKFIEDNPQLVIGVEMQMLANISCEGDEGENSPVIVPEEYVIVKGGIAPPPEDGTAFSGSFGRDLPEAGCGVPHGQVHHTTAGQIRAGGGSVSYAPELSKGGNMNYQHCNVTLGPGGHGFQGPVPNPAPKGQRIQ